jgi:hypothetical protein
MVMPATTFPDYRADNAGMRKGPAFCHPRRLRTVGAGTISEIIGVIRDFIFSDLRARAPAVTKFWGWFYERFVTLQCGDCKERNHSPPKTRRPRRAA